MKTHERWVFACQKASRPECFVFIASWTDDICMKSYGIHLTVKENIFPYISLGVFVNRISSKYRSTDVHASKLWCLPSQPFVFHFVCSSIQFGGVNNWLIHKKPWSHRGVSENSVFFWGGPLTGLCSFLSKCSTDLSRFSGGSVLHKLGQPGWPFSLL